MTSILLTRMASSSWVLLLLLQSLAVVASTSFVGAFEQTPIFISSRGRQLSSSSFMTLSFSAFDRRGRRKITTLNAAVKKSSEDDFTNKLTTLITSVTPPFFIDTVIQRPKTNKKENKKVIEKKIDGPTTKKAVGVDTIVKQQQQDAAAAVVAPILFVIERISDIPTNDKLFQRISNLCIDVFFKEQLLEAKDDNEKDNSNDSSLINGNNKGKLYPWKDWQISYLKNLQAADLRRRRSKYSNLNEMFLAYEVIETSPSTALSKPIIVDMNQVFNWRGSKRKRKKQHTVDNDDEETFYAKGKLLGFVEITQRPYGIATPNSKQQPPEDENFYIDTIEDNNNNLNPNNDPNRPLRPVLTNLAVTKSARQYGIGSKLVTACEQYIVREWKMNEIILEVEDYNEAALQFYIKRGYHILFSDPASRRYDVHGLWLKKVRCQRDVLRKNLNTFGGSNNNPMEFIERNGASNFINFDFVRKMKGRLW